MDKSPATTASLLLRVPARHIAIALLLALAGCGMTTKEEIPVWQYRGPSTPSYEFGDPATGIVALLSLGSGRISGRGDVDGAGTIWVRQRRASRTDDHQQQGDYDFTYRQGRLVLPKRYLTGVTIQLDGKPFLEATVHPLLGDRNAGYWVDLPYVPDLVDAEVTLSTGERYRQLLRIASDAPLNRSHDARHEVYEIVKSSTSGQPEWRSTRLHNQALVQLREAMFAQISSELPLVTSCVSSLEFGAIKRARLTMKAHPQLSPGNDIVISTTEFQQPVYSTFFFHTVKDIRQSIHDLSHGSPPTVFEFVFECETVKGKRLSHALPVNVPAIRAAEG